MSKERGPVRKACWREGLLAGCGGAGSGLGHRVVSGRRACSACTMSPSPCGVCQELRGLHARRPPGRSALRVRCQRVGVPGGV